MAFPSSVKLGAPGVYPYQPAPPRALSGVRMDVCAFAGVAPRGPSRVPVIDEKWRDDRPCVEPERPRSRTVAVAVESFDEYRRLYGGFEGPGLLPYAVASFFEQGGRRAYVARVVHDYADPAADAGGVAAGDVPGAHATAGPLRLRARDEGEWGNLIRAAVEFSARRLYFERADVTGLTLPSDTELQVGALLRATSEDGTPPPGPPAGDEAGGGDEQAAQFSGGKDRFAEIVPEDFFDPSWTFGDEGPADGVQAFASLADEVSLLVAPDLYSPSPLVTVEK